MTTPAAPVGPRGLALRAGVEGKAAALAGDLPGSCPYAASRPFTRRAWLLGYVAGKREARQLPRVDADDSEPWPGPP